MLKTYVRHKHKYAETRENRGHIRHLDKFSQEERGPVLKKEGQTRKFQYGFVEPMMQPYVLMKGLAEGKIIEEQLGVLSYLPQKGWLPVDSFGTT